MTVDICPVCGFDDEYGFEDYQELRESFLICACCGCEYGYDDNIDHYEKWVAKGCNWFVKKRRPQNWSLEDQIKNQIRPWPITNEG